MSDWTADVIEPVEALISRWTDSGNEDALAKLLPGWRANSGLTDGWRGALDALEATVLCPSVSADEASTLRLVASRILRALEDR